MAEVSVIVTTFNRKEFLSETINSILNQTFADFELIVVDNFSNYDFVEHVKSFNDSRIRAYQNQNHGIIAVNRNYGIRKAKGEYIAFCDDDDIWVKNKLEIQINKIKKTGCDLVGSNVIYFRDNIFENGRRSSNHKIINLKDLIKRNQVNTSSVIVRKTNKLIFNEDRNLIAIEDYALWLDLFIGGMTFEFIKQPLVFYRMGKGNISKKRWGENHLKLIYLHVSIMISYPDLRISYQVLSSVFLNSMKYLVKNKLRKHNLFGKY